MTREEGKFHEESKPHLGHVNHLEGDEPMLKDTQEAGSRLSPRFQTNIIISCLETGGVKGSHGKITQEKQTRDGESSDATKGQKPNTPYKNRT